MNKNYVMDQEVLFDKELTSTAKIVYMVLKTNETEHLSYGQVGQMLGFTNQAIQQQIKILEEKGFIKIQKQKEGKRSKNYYKFLK